MDTRDGRIYDAEAASKLAAEQQKYLKQMGHLPTPEQLAAMKVSRNAPCPCGSGKKFKRCCLFGGTRRAS